MYHSVAALFCDKGQARERRQGSPVPMFNATYARNDACSSTGHENEYHIKLLALESLSEKRVCHLGLQFSESVADAWNRI